MNISSDYVNKIKKMYKKSQMGENSRRKKPRLYHLPEFIKKYNPTSLIDYGCGKGSLVKYYKNTIQTVEGYDPCVEEFENIPNKKYDVLISIDVLEHFELEYLTENLYLLNSLFEKAAYIDVNTQASKVFLSDGRNTHLIQEQPNWWQNQILLNMNVKIVNQFWRDNTKKSNYIFILEKI